MDEPTYDAVRGEVIDILAGRAEPMSTGELAAAVISLPNPAPDIDTEADAKQP